MSDGRHVQNNKKIDKNVDFVMALKVMSLNLPNSTTVLDYHNRLLQTTNIINNVTVFVFFSSIIG